MHFLKRLHRSASFWFPAWKRVFPLYLWLQAVLIVFSLYAPKLMYQRVLPPIPLASNSLNVLWVSWFRFDTITYVAIAEKGYSEMPQLRLAFFPLFPMLIHALAWLVHDPLLAGLLIARGAGLILMIVLYQLAKEDLGEAVAQRSMLCLVAFPTALFLWACYPESLFLCLTVLSFYSMHRNRWWLAGGLGMLTCVIRPNGIVLFLPFCFEYLRQRRFSWQAIRWNILSSLLLPAGLLLFALYCYFHSGDLFAFVHEQQNWKRTLHLPWYGLQLELQKSFQQPNSLDALLMSSLDWLPDFLALLLIGLSALRLCRLGSRHWTYVMYATLLWLLANSFPGSPPLLGTGRNMLVIFPLFLMLAQLGRYRWFHLFYLSLAIPLCFLWLTMFLTGYPIV